MVSLANTGTVYFYIIILSRFYCLPYYRAVSVYVVCVCCIIFNLAVKAISRGYDLPANIPPLMSSTVYETEISFRSIFSPTSVDAINSPIFSFKFAIG